MPSAGDRLIFSSTTPASGNAMSRVMGLSGVPISSVPLTSTGMHAWSIAVVSTPIFASWSITTVPPGWIQNGARAPAARDSCPRT